MADQRPPTMFERGIEAGHKDGQRGDWDRMLVSQAFVAAHLPTLLDDPHDELSAGYMVGMVRALRELARQEQEART
jgi:hypothetical protein